MWSALSSRGRGIGASPNANFHASLAASDSIGDQTTCRAPVCAVIPAIAAASAGLSTGPVSRTAFGPADFSRDTTSGLTAAQPDATGAPLPRLTEIGPRALSGS